MIPRKLRGFLVASLPLLTSVSWGQDITDIIFTSVPGQQDNLVPDEPGDTFSFLIGSSRIAFGADQSRWASVFRFNDDGVPRFALFSGVGPTSDGATRLVKGGMPVPDLNNAPLDELNEMTGFGVNSSGTVAWNGAADGLERIFRLQGGDLTTLYNQNGHIVGLLNGNTYKRFSGARVENNNIVHLLGVVTTPDLADTPPIQRSNGLVPIDMVGNQFIPENQGGGTQYTLESVHDDAFTMSPNGALLGYSGTLRFAPAGQAFVLIVGNQVVAQEGFILPGHTAPVAALSQGDARGYIGFSRNAQQVVVRGSDADLNSWVMLNGQTILSSGMPVPDLNDGTVWAPANPATSFRSASVNNNGEVAVVGLSNTGAYHLMLWAHGKSHMVFPAQFPVDLDNDGNLNDGVTGMLFPSIGYLTDDLYYYGLLTIFDSAGSLIGSAFARILCPLPSDIDQDGEVGPNDFSILAGAFGSTSDDPNFVDTADIDGDLEIGPNDFSILASTFGRAR